MPEPGDIAGIVLAAGSSRRFGADKLLHPLALHGASLPLAAHSLLPWLESFGSITVVIRPGSNALREVVAAALGESKSAALRWVVCEDAARGMGASLACGVRANADAAGWMIGLADMPAVPAAAIAGVRNALVAGADLSAASRDGRRGHPVGFGHRYGDELRSLRGDAGARQVLVRDAPHIVQIEIDDEGIFADVDQPGDLHNPQFVARRETCTPSIFRI